VESSVTQADIIGADQALASFVADVSGEYRINLDVSDGLFTDTAEVMITAINQVPVADAGQDQNAAPGDLVVLNGSGSTDADGDSLTYQWTFVGVPAESLVVLEGSDTVNPSFVPDLAGTYTIGLVVNDGEDGSLQDTVDVVVMADNVAPNAIATFSGTLKAGEPVTLDGSQSYDPDNGPEALSFSWLLQSVPALSGLTESIIGTTALTEFIPDVEGDYIVVLTVSDGELSDTAQLAISISNNPCLSPVSNAGADQTIELSQLAVLDGSGSTSVSDCEIIEYSWSLIGVPIDSLLLPDSIDNSTLLTGSSFLPDVAGTYVAQLSVTAGDLTATNTVAITVIANEVPVADAGSDQSVNLGETAILDGTGSYDPDGLPEPLSYSWSIIIAPTGSSAVIEGDTSATASFTPDLLGDYEIQLTVSDGNDSASDTVLVTANEVVIEPLICDINNDQLVDTRDISAILSIINTEASGESDPADWNSDGVINVLDVRGCILQCTLPRCAIDNN
jgi:hypothetical protein